MARETPADPSIFESALRKTNGILVLEKGGRLHTNPLLDRSHKEIIGSITTGNATGMSSHLTIRCGITGF